ncbi:MAG: tetratricopeptide repeat protein, partial [Myxococcota bacterium]
LVLIYGSCLSAFYGLYFGAGWFMARYLFPLSPFLALLWAVGVYQWLLPRLPRPAIAVTAALTVAMVVAQNVRWYKGGDRHPHFQVIEWADENIPKAMWVGAIQTGTLGYFHNRTYNLDGKVNIDAFYATKNDRSGPYVITTDIEYLLDWTGMAEWLTKPAVEAEFRVLTLDYEKNLSVLQRRDRIRLGPDLGYDREAAKIAMRQTASALEKLSTSDTQTRWQLLYQLAWLEDALEDEHEAERRSREALALCEETVKTEAWRRREILNRRQLATILRIHHRIDDAMAETQQAIALLQSSSTAASKQARRDLALSWLEQGELHWELGQYDEAEAKFKAALGELDRLAAEGATTVERDRAVALLSIGDAQLRRGDHAAATKSTQASLAIRKQRHARQPDRQATYDLALAQARLGRLAHLNGDPAGGAEQINASIALRRSLPRIDPGVAEPSPARTIEFNEGLLGTATLDLMVPVKPPTAETP